jgi:hypothetical protein
MSVGLFTASIASAAIAQERFHPSDAKPAWGLSDATVLTLSAWDFEPVTSGQLWGLTAGGYRQAAGTSLNLDATPHLPTGARLTGMELEGCDGTSGNSVNVSLLSCAKGSAPGDFCAVPAFASTGFAETPGCGLFAATGFDVTIDNQGQTYMLNVTYGNDSTLSFRSVRLSYRLQVGAAPAVNTFNDVLPSHPFYQFIEALAASGITAGCGGGNYCPDRNVTRGEMAVFFAKALGLHFPN